MAAQTEGFAITFPDGYDARSEFETPARGYLSDVVVRLENGTSYQLFFVDPARLQQELAENGQSGKPYFVEPNLIVLPEVSTASIRKAVEGLVQASYFQHLKPR